MGPRLRALLQGFASLGEGMASIGEGMANIFGGPPPRRLDERDAWKQVGDDLRQAMEDINQAAEQVLRKHRDG